MWWERSHVGTRGEAFALGPLHRMLIASHGIWFYVGKLVWPANLTFSYPRWAVDPANPLAYGWLTAGAGLGLAIYLGRRYVGRSVEVAALFYVVTLSPYLGFIMLYTFRFSFVADHCQYIACLGPVALAAAGITVALGRFKKRGLRLKPALCGVLLLVLGTLTWQQAQTYTDREKVWRTTIARNPDSYMAEYNLGCVLLSRGEAEEAFLHFRNALRLRPGYLFAQQNLGLALLRKGQVDEAIAHFRKALEIRPAYAEAHNNLGKVLLQKGRANEAIAEFQQALRLRPDLAGARSNLNHLLEKAR